MDLKGDIINATTTTYSQTSQESYSKAPTPVKQYEVTYPGTFSLKNLEIRQNGNTVYTSTRNYRFLKPTRLDIRAGAENNVLAAAEMRSSKRHSLFLADGSSELARQDFLRETKWDYSKYSFVHGGRTYTWTRTHRKELHASSWSNRDFKLTDTATGDILAVYRYNCVFLQHHLLARIDFYAELEQELEALSLMAILGIEHCITQRGE